MEQKIERRKMERFNLEIPVKIEVISKGQEKARLELVTSNICAGGAFFHTKKPLPEGTQVKIDMILPLDQLEKLKNDYKKAYIKLTGTVLRTESKGMAISFNKDYEISPWKKRPTKTALKRVPTA